MKPVYMTDEQYEAFGKMARTITTPEAPMTRLSVRELFRGLDQQYLERADVIYELERRTTPATPPADNLHRCERCGGIMPLSEAHFKSHAYVPCEAPPPADVENDGREDPCVPGGNHGLCRTHPTCELAMKLLRPNPPADVEAKVREYALKIMRWANGEPVGMTFDSVVAELVALILTGGQHVAK